MKRLRACFVTASTMVVAVILTGCSAAPTPSTAPHRATTSAVGSQPPHPPQPPQPPQPPTTSTTTTQLLAGAGNQCTAGDLRPSWRGIGNGASEHLFYVVNLQNISGRACVSGGYVGVSAYEPNGNLIPASEQRTSIGPDGALSVGPGASMNFSIGLPDVDIEAGGTVCSTEVGALHLIPPNERAAVQIATPISTGYPKLCGTSFLVGPLQSGAITN